MSAVQQRAHPASEQWPSDSGIRSHRGRNHIASLERRMDHLAKRIAESAKDLSYDRQELSAIRWALLKIDAHAECEVGGRDR